MCIVSIWIHSWIDRDDRLFDCAIDYCEAKRVFLVSVFQGNKNSRIDANPILKKYKLLFSKFCRKST